MAGYVSSTSVYVTGVLGLHRADVGLEHVIV